MSKQYCLFEFEHSINKNSFQNIVLESIESEICFVTDNIGYITYYDNADLFFNLHPILVNDFNSPLTMMISPIKNDLAFELLKQQKIFFFNEIRFIADVVFMSQNTTHIRLMLSRQLDGIDLELINTAKAFIGCGLNASKAAEKLYVHRNTFNYRMNKLVDKTGIDIREYHNSVFFEMCLLVKRK